MLCDNIELSNTKSSKRKFLPLHKALIQLLFLKSITFFATKDTLSKTIKDLLGPGASTRVIAVIISCYGYISQRFAFET